MRKTITGVLSALAAWLLLFSMLLAGVFVCTTSRAFYRMEYAKYNQAANIGVTDDGLMRITNSLLDYLWGTRDSLDMQAEINGEIREVFTQREKDHMVDVRDLVGLARIVMLEAFIGGVALWAIAYLIGKRSRGGVRACGTGYLIGVLTLLIGVGAVVLLAMQDFTAVFIKFHQIFFTNDLWLLDANDMLILMVPEPFFADCGILIALVFGLAALLTSILAMIFIVRDKNKAQEDDWEQTLTRVDGGDGSDFYRIAPDKEEQRPDASEIFARMGLKDEAEETSEPQDDAEMEEEETMPVNRLMHVAPQEPETVLKSRAYVQPVALEVPQTPVKDDLSVRFEMKLDLKIKKGEDGRLVLSVDPDQKPQVSLTSQPGMLGVTVQEMSALEESTAELIQPVTIEAKLEKSVPAAEPAPSPEELLQQMDKLMQGFPGNKEDKSVDLSGKN